MNGLQIFSQDVIPVYTTSIGEKIVIGRELHERLKIVTPYHKWFPRMCEYGFQSESDYTEVADKNVQNPQGGRPATDHYLKLDMAKHIAMIQRTPEGKTIRDKLISLETNIAELSPELRALIKIELTQKEQAKALEVANARIDNISDIVALNPNSWRADARNLIAKIAQKMGGNEYIKDVQAEIFKLVDERAGVSLSTRLTNKRRRMADEGVCKSKRDKLNKMDVIADDKKLVEIYIAVVKEMCIKHGVVLPD